MYEDLIWHVAHKETYEKAKILHRDISVGNILITSDGHGLLIDWDLCNSTLILQGARQRERTVCSFYKRQFACHQPIAQGTWQFMAARLLMSPHALTHELADNLESFLHVLSLVALR